MDNMSEKLELVFRDREGNPLSFSDVHLDSSGVIVESHRGNRMVVMTSRELANEIDKSPVDDPPIYVRDPSRDRQWRIDIPRIADVKKSYVQGDITMDEFEGHVERALEHHGDPDGVYDFEQSDEFHF